MNSVSSSMLSQLRPYWSPRYPEHTAVQFRILDDCMLPRLKARTQLCALVVPPNSISHLSSGVFAITVSACNERGNYRVIGRIVPTKSLTDKTITLFMDNPEHASIVIETKSIVALYQVKEIIWQLVT